MLDELLEPLKNDERRAVLYKCLGLTLSDEGKEGYVIVEWSIICLLRLDAWISTVVLCLMERETRGEYHQKVYFDTYRRFLVNTSE